MLTDTSIKFLNSSNLNGPLLNTDWGALIRLYDACLVNGINPLNISNLTMSGSTAESSDIVTLTYLTPHGYQQYQVLLITGAEIPALNGEHRILTVSADGLSLTFKINTNIVDAGNTLNIITKLAPFGWTKVFSETNKAIYKMNSSEGPNHYFFVWNDNPNNMGGTGYGTNWTRYAITGFSENIADGFNPQGLCFPSNWTDLPASGNGATMKMGCGKVYYANSNNYNLENCYDLYDVSAGNRYWEMYGNESYFYLINSFNVNFNWSRSITGCGQYDCLHQGYNYNTFHSVCSWDTKIPQDWMNGYIDFNQIVGSENERSIRSLSNLNNISNPTLRVRSFPGTTVSGYNGGLNVNGPVNLIKAYLIDTDNVLMGALKNLYHLAATRPLNNGQIFQQGENIYKATNLWRASSSYEGQIVLKLV
jgi:hypothetical protein